MTTAGPSMSFNPDDVKLRTYSFDIEGVELVRTPGGDGREITGIAVPYGVDQLIYPGLVERFEVGSFANQIRAMYRVPFVRDHMARGGVPIGRIHSAEETATGLRVKMRVSLLRDPVADDTLTLINDGVLEELSIGFVTLSKDMPNKEGITVRKKAQLTEVAVVTAGAYGQKAKISSVRSEGGEPAHAEPPSNRDVAVQLLARLPLPGMIGS